MSIWDTITHFEDDIKNHCGFKYAVAVDSCTNAIFLCMKYAKDSGFCGIVEIPKFTYISVPMSVINAGCMIKFTDNSWDGNYILGNTNIIDSANEVFISPSDQFDKNVCLSFHFKKPISTGKGGMILTNDASLYEWAIEVRYDGRSGYSYNDLLVSQPKYIGYHMYMTPEQACRGLESFYSYKNKDPFITGSSKNFKVDLSQLEVFKPWIKY